MGRASIIAVPLVTPRELNQSGTGTTEVAFTSDGTVPVFLRLPSAGQLAEANGTTTSMFKVRAWGRVTGGTTTNFTVQIHYHASATSATITASREIEGSGAQAVNSESGNWWIESLLTWDTTSNKLNGVGSSMVNRSVTTAAISDNEITSIDPDADDTNGFIVAGTFSAGNASNKAVLDGFVLEEV